MKPLSPRQHKLLQLLTQKGDLTVAEIRALGEISQATAYREMQALVQGGFAQKTTGGLTLPASSTEHCLHCHRPVNPRLVFHIEQANGTRRAACCAHCGLLALRHQTDTYQATTLDFLYGALLGAAQAWYVLESGISPCCSPSALAFSTKTDAERFAAGFNGQVYDFLTAQTHIEQLMSIHQAD